MAKILRLYPFRRAARDPNRPPGAARPTVAAGLRRNQHRCILPSWWAGCFAVAGLRRQHRRVKFLRVGV